MIAILEDGGDGCISSSNVEKLLALKNGILKGNWKARLGGRRRRIAWNLIWKL